MKKYYPWVLVALLWFVALLNYMDRQMLSTMQEAMKVDIAELNHAEAFGALMAVFLVDLRYCKSIRRYYCRPSLIVSGLLLVVSLYGLL